MGRQELDNARINDVIWTPYDDYPDIGDETAEDREYGLHVFETALYRTYLIDGHICEGYMSDYVLQQFRLHHGISADLLQWERREKRERREKKYDNWGYELRYEIDMWMNHLDYFCQADKDMCTGKLTQ
ncbi:uncharacterized protein LOC110008098 [Amborella trichopoda]|nr:uncharacterized protein LOC110008098 [Amborella trichopoda]|eukprot:XP_020529150.1 uncharacterized protein LOC110008098 [Amborella trichopoda]